MDAKTQARFEALERKFDLIIREARLTALKSNRDLREYNLQLSKTYLSLFNLLLAANPQLDKQARKALDSSLLLIDLTNEKEERGIADLREAIAKIEAIMNPPPA